MNANDTQQRALLQDIAQKAMLERGLLPDFSAEAIAELGRIQAPAANKVERQVGKSAAALLLESRIGERFDAIVTGASPKGTWVRLVNVPVEGKVVHGFEGIDVGDRIRVQLIFTDVERGYIDFRKVDPSRR